MAEDTEVLGRAKDWETREVNIGYIQRPEGQKGKYGVLPDSSNFKIDTLNIGNIAPRPQPTPLYQQPASAPAPSTSTLAPPIPHHPASFGPPQAPLAAGVQFGVDQGSSAHSGAHFSAQRPQLGSTSTSMSTPPSDPPEFKYGIVAAVAAHAHLRAKAEFIDTLLRGYGIEPGQWTGQVGFRLDASRDGDDNGVELPPTLHQEIMITLPKYRAVKGRRRDLVEGLKEKVSPFFGVVRFVNSTKTWDLESHNEQAPKTATSDGLLVDQCSRSYASTLRVDEPDDGQAPLVSLSAINFAHNTDPGNHFTTSAAFTLEKENNASLHPSKIKFSELKFEGPSHYAFQSASARVIMDQPSSFEHVSPEEKFEIDPNVPVKAISQRTTKKDERHTAQVEVAPNSAKLGYQLSKGSGEEDMRSVETMRNAWQVRHSHDTRSKTIRYFMSSSPAPGRQNVLPDVEQLRPSMRFTPETRALAPKKVVVRLWSFWTQAESQGKSKSDGVLKRVFYPLVGKGGSKGKEESRVYTNVAHCIEVTVPLDFVGAARKTEERNVILEDLWNSSA